MKAVLCEEIFRHEQAIAEKLFSKIGETPKNMLQKMLQKIFCVKNK
nr:MAG TPA: hypothetical protein [Caudoviricetes sp.]